MKKWSSQWTQFMQLRKEAWKKNNSVQTPLKSWIFFFHASLRNCINCFHCDDHFFIFISFPQFIFDWFHISLTISNSLPTNEDICSSLIITWSVCYRACAKVLRFTITNKHGRLTEANVMSSTVVCGRILSAPGKKVEKVERKRKTDTRW